MKKLLLTLIVLSTTFLNAQNVPSYVPPDSLIGWWPFDGNANDESGNNNNGTVYGAVLAVDRNGNSNGAYHFDGIDDYISVAHNQSLAITGDITMHAIFRSEGHNGISNHQTIINKRSGGYWPYNLSICYNSYAEKQVLSGRRNPGAPNDYKYSSDSISINQWEVWTITIQSDTIRFYRNGALDTVQYFTLSAVDYAAELLFGRIGLNETLPEFFKGDIDDIGIWNRALTSIEIQDLYNANECSYIDTVLLSVTDTLVIDVNFVGLNPIQYEYSLKAYPNPTKDMLFIDSPIDFITQGYNLEVKNSLGQSIFQGPINQSQIQLDLTTWGAGGLYFLHLYDNTNNLLDVKKIILK